MLYLLILFAVLALIVCLAGTQVLPPRGHSSGAAFFSGRPFAHRGLHQKGLIPENSLAAFQRACEHHYGIELDVRMSKDGHLCILHDRSLNRMAGHDLKIDSLDLKAIQAYHLEGTAEHVPSLAEALKVVDGRVPLIIEMKSNGLHDDPARIPRSLQKAMADYPGPWCVESFDARMLRVCRRLGYTVPLGQLSARQPLFPFAKWLQGMLVCNLISRPDFIAYEKGASPPGWRFYRRHSVPLIAWTVRSKDEWNRIRDVYSNYIFEGFDPDEENDH